MGRQKYSPARSAGGQEMVSASPVPVKWVGEIYPQPRALTRSEIYEIVEKFASASERGKRAGYDMVEFHGAHGYLLEQFTSPYMNLRTDEFGGSLENRARFPIEVVKAARRAVGPDFPLGYRISALEYVAGGITLEESQAFAQMLEEAGIDYINVSNGFYETFDKFITLMRDDEGWNEYTWEAITNVAKVPTLIGDGLKNPSYCEKLLKEKKGDLIGLARPFLADPYWPTKAKEGRVEDIRMCISCCECLTGSGARIRRAIGSRRCAVNPGHGRDSRFPEIPLPAAVSKTVMVIGGGPAGMEAARIAALRGHEVTLYEKGQQLGGQLLIAGSLTSKKTLPGLVRWFNTQLKKLGVKVELGKEVTPEIIEKANPDAVVIATGAEPIIPDIPGLGGNNVIGAWDLIARKVKLSGEKVVVVGGGAVGVDAAECLVESGNKVTIIKRRASPAYQNIPNVIWDPSLGELAALGTEMEPVNRWTTLQLLKEKDVRVLARRQAIGITEKGVRVKNLDTEKEELIEADRVVIAMGSKSLNTLGKVLEDRLPENKLYIVGDCNQPRVILEAIYEGSLAGRQI
jgi:2,4-dienoyl-CoA reductase-like NADH-dependent reductase (Old Yellow Enzyme family)/thioredoxin reductase